MGKRNKIFLILGMAALLLGGTLFAHNYQYLLRYMYVILGRGGPLWFQAYVVTGTTYDAAQMTVNSLVASLQTREPPSRSPLRSIELRVENGSLKKLVSDLDGYYKMKRAPEREQTEKALYYKAWLKYPDGKWRRVKYRLRGISPFHWHKEKPSLRVKLRRSDPIGMLRHINLISPEDRPMIANIVADDVAREMGLLTHVSEMVRVFVNGRFEGVYQLQSRQDEEMLRANQRLPGPMYFGNALKKQWKKEDFEIVAEDSWLKDLPTDPLREMLAAIARPSSVERYRKLWSVLDLDNYARWHATSVLVGSLHTDYHHNQLFYFDPSTGKLEFVMNDANGHGMFNYPSTWRRIVRPFVPDQRSPLNERINPLLDVALRDPRFHDRRNAALYRALTGVGSTESQTRLLKSYFKAIDGDVLADRHKGALQDTFVGIKRMPYTNGQYEDAKRDVLAWVRDRNAFLLDELNKATVRVRVSRRGDGGPTLFVVEVDGNAAVTFDTAAFKGALRADKTFDGQPGEPALVQERLHPGLREDNEFAYKNTHFVRRVPEYYLRADVQRYLFAAGMPPGDVVRALSNAFVHGLSGDPVTVEVETVDAIDPATVVYNPVSLHPWRFPAPKTGRISLGPGVVELTEDLIVGPGQGLVVRPGTELLLGPGVSIASRGRTEIVGRPDAPIVIRRLRADQAWGAIAILGPDARDSRIAFADISGGSLGSLFNVPFSGMVNVHWADGFSLENSVVGSNVGSDDTVHIVHSRFALTGVTLDNCFGDCVDLDYADGSATDIRIRAAGNDGIDFMTSDVSLDRVHIDGAGDKGLSVGEMSNVQAARGTIERAAIAVAVKDGSTLRMAGWKLTANQVGMDIYKKNWRYGGPGRAEVAESTFRSNDLDLRVAKDGEVVFQGMDIPPTIENNGTIRTSSAPGAIAPEPLAWKRKSRSADGEWAFTP